MFPNCFYMPLLAWATCNFGRLWNTASRSFSKLCESWKIMRNIEKLRDHVLQQLNPLQNQLSMLYSRSIDYRINCPCSTQGQPPHPQTCIKSRIPPSTVRHLGPPYQHIVLYKINSPKKECCPYKITHPTPTKMGTWKWTFLFTISKLFLLPRQVDFVKEIWRRIPTCSSRAVMKRTVTSERQTLEGSLSKV